MVQATKAAVRRQLEYYFNDYNLMRDQFLKNEIKLSKDGGKDGFVDLDIMLKFNRLAELTKDKTEIIASISDSKLVELNSDQTSVRRNPERKLPVDDEIYRAGLKSRTCYVDGFPRDEYKHEKSEEPKEPTISDIKPYFPPAEGGEAATVADADKTDVETPAVAEAVVETKTEEPPAETEVSAGTEDKPAETEDAVEAPACATLDEIFEYFEALDLYPETIAMRRIKGSPIEALNGRFTGSIFVTFLTQADTDKFMDTDAKFRGDIEVKKMTKSVYWSVQNARNEAKKRGGNVQAAIDAAKKKAKAMEPKKFAEGSIIVFSGVTDATIRREDFKDFILEAEGAVDYISFETGKTCGKILLNLQHGKSGNELVTESTLMKNIKGNDVTFEKGSEENFNDAQMEYSNFKRRMEAGKNFKGKGKRRTYKGKERGHRDNGRGNGRDNGRKRENTKIKFGSGDEGEPEAKAVKAEE